jgi:uncharacterized membrane protein YeaQ/YmgE (transglycosylase-associated protein family)
MLGSLIAGLLTGAAAKLFMPGRDPGGVLVTILLGMAGALLAGWAGRFVGWIQPDEPAGWVASVLGALFVIWTYRQVTRRRTIA